MAFVLDASVTVAWKIPDEQSNRPLDILARADEETVVVPLHWQAEVANALLTAERRKRIDMAQVARFTSELSCLAIETDTDGAREAFVRILPLARAHRLTIYDALYLELAQRRGLPLASLDKDLRDAATSVGVNVIP